MAALAPLLALVALAAAPQGRWVSLPAPERAEVWAELHARPFPARVVGMGGRFLGTPYLVSPLGEGRGRDPDPLFRYDAVDCLTFVEETLALSLAPRFDEVEAWATRLRYDGPPAYENRNHLVEAQWLPHLHALGLLRDVTSELAPGLARRSDKALTPATWRAGEGRSLALPKEREPLGRFPLTVLPLAEADAPLARAPEGTLLLVVREERPTKVTRVTHLGFLVRDGDRVLFRHATKGWLNAVIDEELGHFLARVRRHNATEPWKVVGVSLFQPQEPSLEVGTRGAP